ncbi:uncharacterized protein K460DRAFT_71083 [Cucurbitaria berberidis CBS 394.84]|uniref:Uncharacterized protein n=1 Tax=Cucurbitaria berberidis CBS 394.84 TaxID=1168544 RepID=A0A9P4GN91_9PLEO|nr:uncharacterized protein K460DRAFT_71083 [Cucurbitaria berberidis CBS 394.84]KAF1848307.1 hypothetical protein K460DRAFT_71083 [Cucurbitaria berberidis CBS 394.84]
MVRNRALCVSGDGATLVRLSRRGLRVVRWSRVGRRQDATGRGASDGEWTGLKLRHSTRALSSRLVSPLQRIGWGRGGWRRGTAASTEGLRLYVWVCVGVSLYVCVCVCVYVCRAGQGRAGR